jgi:hypothetical protein
MSVTVEPETDSPDGGNPAGLTIGSLVCSGVAVVLFFASFAPGAEGIVWWWVGLALTVLVAALAVMTLRSGLPLRHKLAITAGAAVPVPLYTAFLMCQVFAD